MIIHTGEPAQQWAPPTIPAYFAAARPMRNDQAAHQIRIITVGTNKTLAVSCTCRQAKRPRGWSPVPLYNPIALIVDAAEAFDAYQAYHDALTQPPPMEAEG